MLLSASEIERAIRRGDLVLDPFDPTCLKPASYVLRLGNQFAIPPTGRTVEVGVPSSPPLPHRVEQAEVWDLEPGSFVLGCTLEAVGCSDTLAGFLSDLSHHGRVGLGVHGGSQLVSPGFGLRTPTRLTLELTNRSGNVLRLRAGTPVVHLVFAQVEGDALIEKLPLGRSAYEGAGSPSGPRFEETWPVPPTDT